MEILPREGGLNWCSSEAAQGKSSSDQLGSLYILAISRQDAQIFQLGKIS